MISLSSLRELLRSHDGTLTEELRLKPNALGLGHLPSRLQPDALTTMVCGYCSTGCSLVIHMKEGKAINLTPDGRYPVNQGMACPKGWEALRVLESPERAVQPLRRNEDGGWTAVGWEYAVLTFVSRMKALQEKYGKGSVAFLGTGQIPTEELAFLGTLAKCGMGFLHGDGNTRQCMASAVVAYKQSFGFDAPPYTYQDLEESDTIVLVGSNLCIAHPILWERITRNPHQPRIIVVDPRRTETAQAATHHFAPEPKTDLTLFYGVAHLLLEWNAWDPDFVARHTEDFGKFRNHVASFTPEYVADHCRMRRDEVEELARLIAEGKRVSFWWTMGVNQSHQGVLTAQALINLALMTGHMGKPGTGANSITGQCNAMGSRLFSNTASLLGGRDFTKAEHRKKVADILNLDESRMPQSSGYAYDQIIDAIDRGEIKGLWIIATNSAHSWVQQNRLKNALSKLEFLVVQDMYLTSETAQLADLVLPAAGWGEKEGTFINSERRIGRIRKVAKAPGQALADFSILRLLAEAWGLGHEFSEWTDPESVFKMLSRLSEGQPCDFSRLQSYEDLGAYGVQWPVPEGEVAAERRLFADGRFFHSDGRARFVFADPVQPRERTSAEFPYLLLTGRGTSAQWHTETRTRQSPMLKRLYRDEAIIEICPEDAQREGWEAEDWVLVTSAHGQAAFRCVVTGRVKSGQVFIPMHKDRVNRLIPSEFDPQSRQPSYKITAVQLKKISGS
ncbi:MAG TPA: nitrate reductase [Oligoflexus sp.]|uniref:molybdopterin oxidoreductase family protein n=1 Tax=Oligoflexus sp. TaxID=1971216 RepID=UPI002D7E1591|nr:nitrate reductase [Oligoflexus sp.]HET9238274.1 nitrate reductase [Oligoflexus sp.]